MSQLAPKFVSLTLGWHTIRVSAEIAQEVQQLLDQELYRDAVRCLARAAQVTLADAERLILEDEEFVLPDNSEEGARSAQADSRDYWRGRLNQSKKDLVIEKLVGAYEEVQTLLAMYWRELTITLAIIVILAVWTTRIVPEFLTEPHLDTRYVYLNESTNQLTYSEAPIARQETHFDLHAQRLQTTDGTRRDYVGYLVRRSSIGNMEVRACYDDMAVGEWYAVDSFQGRSIIESAADRYGEGKAISYETLPVAIVAP